MTSKTYNLRAMGGELIATGSMDEIEIALNKWYDDLGNGDHMEYALITPDETTLDEAGKSYGGPREAGNPEYYIEVA